MARSLKDEGLAAQAQVNALVARILAFHHSVTGEPEAAPSVTQPPAPAQVSTSQPAQPPPAPVSTSQPGPPPVPVQTAHPAEADFQADDVIMTCFMNQEDEGVETPAAPDDPPKRTALDILVHYQDGLRISGIALPWKVRPGRIFDITLKSTGRTARGVHQVDEGPWGTRDPWLENRTRPIAEGLRDRHVVWSKSDGAWIADPNARRICNGAGVDGTPLLWAMLLDKPVEEVYGISPSGKISIREYDAPTGAQVTPPPLTTAPAAHTAGKLTLVDVVARARSGLSLEVNYAIGTGGQCGTAPLPGTLLKNGTRQADCSGFGDWCEGVSRDESGWNTDYAFSDAKGPQKHYKLVASGQIKPGHKLVAPSPGPGHYGHEGVVSRVTNGIADRVIHCSSMNPEGHAIAETDTSWFDKHHAIAVEYLGLAAA